MLTPLDIRSLLRTHMAMMLSRRWSPSFQGYYFRCLVCCWGENGSLLDASAEINGGELSFCPWKGTAHYLNVVVNGETETDAAWHYPDPKPAAAEIEGRVAFWGEVAVLS